MTDDPETQARREELFANLQAIDAIRAGTWKPDGEAPSGSRLALLGEVDPSGGKPTGRPNLRVIPGGRKEP